MAIDKKVKMLLLAALVLAVIVFVFYAFQYTKPAGPAVNLSLVDKEKMVFTAIYPGVKQNNLAAIDLVHKWPRQPAMVIVEPNGINLTEFARGGNDLALRAMLDYVSEQGLGGSGTIWVPFSEYNDFPGSPNPKEFVPAVNHFAAVAKAEFPGSKIGVLLDCRSNLGYRDINLSGSYGTVSLVPYIDGLDNNNVTVLFFQGFPRVTPEENVTRAVTFLNADEAVEAAKGLGVGEIRFVTGTASVYGADGSKKIRHTPAERSEIIDDIEDQVSVARQAGYNVKLVIFAENKSRTQADWSYGGNTALLRRFAGGATSSGIEVTLFDPKGEIELSSLA